MNPASFSDHDPATLGHLFEEWGYKPSHAGRVLRQFYAKNGDPGFLASTDSLPAPLRNRLESMAQLPASRVVRREVARDGTVKLLVELGDLRRVESVLMPDRREDRAAGCVSSQVGCAMGCDFCATAQNGFERHLTPGEIVAQFLLLRQEASAMGRRVQTLVFMGMGEPLLNLDAVLAAVQRIGDNRMGALGWRQITVSTVGIVPGIAALQASPFNVQLAVSLHAPDDVTRASLLPMGRRFGIADILAAADAYQASRRHPVIIQYCLLAGVNDSPDHAQALATAIGGRRMHINLLRYNATGPGLGGRHYVASEDTVASAFAGILQKAGLIAHFRRSRGDDINAACGQLKRIPVTT